MVSLHPAAIEEAREARRFYAERDPRLADAFMAELDHAIERIQAQPDAWPPHDHGTRRFLTRRFPYAVVYRARGESLEVIAFAHLRRRPGYWKER